MIDDKILNNVRSWLPLQISAKRLSHTLGVEREIIKLSQLYAPELLSELRLSALLHDITKEYTVEQHTEIYNRYGQKPTLMDLSAPKTLHAQTAAMLIPTMFPITKNTEIASWVRWHTTGKEHMTIPEMLLYLADYIEDTRTFEDCVVLRNHFWKGNPECMSSGQKMHHLYETMLMSFDMTIRCLLEDKVPISLDTVLARNDFVFLLKKEEEK